MSADIFEYAHVYNVCYSEYVHKKSCTFTYGVATMCRLLKIIGLFCRISSFL